VLSVKWDANGGHFNPTPPVKLIVRPRARAGIFREYDVTLDGKRFLMIKRGSDKPSATGDVLVVVQNGVDDLKRLLPLK
jgi:hypothetical protein